MLQSLSNLSINSVSDALFTEALITILVAIIEGFSDKKSEQVSASANFLEHVNIAK